MKHGIIFDLDGTLWDVANTTYNSEMFTAVPIFIFAFSYDHYDGSDEG